MSQGAMAPLRTDHCFVLPATSDWWLQHYVEYGQHVWRYDSAEVEANA
jgi:hypothetical protein